MIRPRAGRLRRNIAKLPGFLLPAMPGLPAFRLAAVLIALASMLASPSLAQGYSREAERVLTRAFAATGGKGWYLLRGWRETGRQGGAPYETWIDPVRYGLRTEKREGDGLRIHGFNGQADWTVSPTGQIVAVNDRATLAQARTDAFLAANYFFFRGRFDARGEYLGVKSLGGASYDVLKVQPYGGEARELWFDRSTHLLARIVDRSGRRATAVRVHDYRKIGPVRAPFRFTPEAGSPESLRRERAEISFAPVDRERFSLDRPKELARVEAARAAP